MKLKNKYFLLRHGQNIYQTKKKSSIYPWPEPKNSPVRLNKKGERQIKNAAKKLKDQKIDLIYSSDVFRARQSAEIVAKELGIKKINFDKELRDINLGIYHGGSKKRFYQDFPRSAERFSKRPKKGENWSDCQKRILGFLKKIDKKHQNKNILIVSHGDPLWLLEGAINGLNNKKLLDMVLNNYIKTGELRRLN